MGKAVYIGESNVARKVKKKYVGVDGVSRKVKKAYIGADGVARLYLSSGFIVTVEGGVSGRAYVSHNTTSNKYLTGSFEFEDGDSLWVYVSTGSNSYPAKIINNVSGTTKSFNSSGSLGMTPTCDITIQFVRTNVANKSYSAYISATT